MRSVSKTRHVWVLKSDEQCAIRKNEKHGMTFIPVWPSMAAAKRCASGTWVQYKPVAIEVERLRRQWSPKKMIANKQGIEVFPTPADPGFEVNASLFHADLGYVMGERLSVCD
ncbi:MAG: DUF2750 domain-containing protein [Verrucomicrobiota bacterium]